MGQETTQAVPVGTIAGQNSVIDLGVQHPISRDLQQVRDENGNTTALYLASNGAEIRGEDVVGGALPLRVTGTDPVLGESWGRLVRLTGAAGGFYDIGIDAKNNLFINTPRSTATEHVLVINGNVLTFAGTVVVNDDFRLPNIAQADSAPPGAILKSLVVDTRTGTLYYQ